MAIHPELETRRLTLRRLTADDAPFIVGLLNEPSFLENIGDRGVRTSEDAQRYLLAGPLEMYARYGFGLWHVARSSDGCPVGMCGLLKRDALPDFDLGYAYFPAFWGQGYALEAAEATLRHVRRYYGVSRVVAVVSPGNRGSIRVLEKAGMRFDRMLALNSDEPEVGLYARDLSGE